MIIIRNGFLVTEEYFFPYTRTSQQNVYSCTKSVLSALFGIAQGQGSVPPADARALPLLPGSESISVDDRMGLVTVDNLLCMSAGIPAMRAVDMATARDQVAFALGKPLAFQPGSGFFTPRGPHLLSAILQHSVGMSARDYAAKKLFTPMGINGRSWDVDGMGVTIGATNLSLTAIDLAKIGYLFLRKGDWFGTRVLPGIVGCRCHTHACATFEHEPRGKLPGTATCGGWMSSGLATRRTARGASSCSSYRGWTWSRCSPAPFHSRTSRSRGT